MASPDSVALSSQLQASLAKVTYAAAHSEFSVSYAARLQQKHDDNDQMKEEMASAQRRVDSEANAKLQAIAAREACEAATAATVKQAKDAARKAYAAQLLEERVDVSRREIQRHVDAALAHERKDAAAAAQAVRERSELELEQLLPCCVDAVSHN